MSWNSYIDNLIGQSGGAIDKACLFGLDGSSWTTSDHAQNLNISQCENKVISTAFNTGDFTKLQANGIVIEGVKYQFLRAEDKFILGKKKDHGAVTLQKTCKGVVIGHTAEGQQQGNGNKAVGNVADYLVTLDM